VKDPNFAKKMLSWNGRKKIMSIPNNIIDIKDAKWNKEMAQELHQKMKTKENRFAGDF
jgi:hypothetical protein